MILIVIGIDIYYYGWLVIIIVYKYVCIYTAGRAIGSTFGNISLDYCFTVSDIVEKDIKLHKLLSTF